MPWTNQGGGGAGGPGGGGPWGRGPQRPTPPNLEDVLRKGQDRMRDVLPSGFGGGKGLILIALVVFLVWVATGIYRVDAGQQGVALIFGKWWATTEPGLHYNLPAPIGSVEAPEVERIHRTEVGMRTGANFGRAANTRAVTEESLMLTGDENIIDIQFVVLWKISDAGKYLFNVRNPEEAVKNAAEAAMREVVGRSEFEFVRTQGRGEIQQQARDLMEQILNSYRAGILITSIELQQVDPPSQVIDAFRDVQAARADRESAVNQSQAYLNEVTNRAEGEAEQLVRAAEAYKEEQIARATGDSERFLAVYNEYKDEPAVTRRRIYLETMENLFGGMDKILIDTKAGGTGPVPYLPLNELMRRPGGTGGQGETR